MNRDDQQPQQEQPISSATITTNENVVINLMYNRGLEGREGKYGAEPRNRNVAFLAALKVGPLLQEIFIDPYVLARCAYADKLLSRETDQLDLMDDRSSIFQMEIELPEFDYLAVEILVNYLYTGQVATSVEFATLLELARAAMKFEMEDVFQYCLTVIASYINRSNWLKIRVFAHEQGFAELHRAVLEFCKNNWADVSGSEEFLKLGFSEVTELITNCTGSNYETTLDAITKWVAYDKDKVREQQHLFSLIQLIGMDVLDMEFFQNSPRVVKNCFEKEPVKNNSGCCDEMRSNEKIKTISDVLKEMSKTLTEIDQYEPMPGTSKDQGPDIDHYGQTPGTSKDQSSDIDEVEPMPGTLKGQSSDVDEFEPTPGTSKDQTSGIDRSEPTPGTLKGQSSDSDESEPTPGTSKGQGQGQGHRRKPIKDKNVARKSQIRGNREIRPIRRFIIPPCQYPHSHRVHRATIVPEIRQNDTSGQLKIESSMKSKRKHKRAFRQRDTYRSSSERSPEPCCSRSLKKSPKNLALKQSPMYDHDKTVDSSDAEMQIEKPTSSKIVSKISKKRRIRKSESELKVEASSDYETRTIQIQNKILVYFTKVEEAVWIKGHNFDVCEPRDIWKVETPRKFSSLGFHKGTEMIYNVGGAVVDPAEWVRGSWDTLNGLDYSNPCGMVEKYIREDSEGYHSRHLCDARKDFGLAVYGDYLYATGGCIGSCATNAVERLPLESIDAEWEDLASSAMLYTRFAHSLAVLGDKLYVIGGVGAETDSSPESTESPDEPLDLDSVEVFDHSDLIPSWQPVPKMNSPRAYAMCATMQGKIYVLGGSKKNPYLPTRREILITAECYDPVKNLWTNIPKMIKCRSGGVVVAQDPLLFVIGGDSKYRPSMEVYDSRINRWILLDWPTGLSREADLSSAIVIDIDQ